MNELDINNNVFEQIKHIDENGNEYWEARELQTLLNYKEWRKFSAVINKAKLACEHSPYVIEDHFVGSDKMVKTGDSIRKINDYKLSRYACNNSSIKETEHFPEVRKPIIGGTMPEDLPTPKKSIKQIEKEKNMIKESELNEK